MTASTSHTTNRNPPELIRNGALSVNGVRVPLLSGEVQFFRMDPAGWENALRQVKGAGLPMVSTYLSWRRFSIGPDRYDLEGRTDPRLNVRRFLDLCVALGLWVTMKPGPWICAEEANGGYPDWLVEKKELQVLSAAGAPVAGYNPPFQSPVPSYLHPVYLQHVGRWLSDVDAALAEYFYPRGPILLVQLDNEPSMTFHDRLLESDYNAVNVGENGLYQKWLEDKYGTIGNLNRCHRRRWRRFSDVPAPRALQLSALEELTRYTDWVEFKEDLMARHIARLRQFHLEHAVDRVLFTINYNEHRQIGVPNDWHALEMSSGLGGFDYYPRMPLDDAGLADIALFVGYSRVCNVLPWSPEIMCGTWSFKGQERQPGGLTSADFEYLYLCCIAFGLKGMNFYMFADRDNWIDSPLDCRGNPGPTMEAVKNVIRLVTEEPDFEHFERRQEAAVLYYRPSAREAFISDAAGAALTVGGHSLGSSYRLFTSVFAELHRLNVDPAIADPVVQPGKLSNHRLILVPGAPAMDESTLSLLDEFEAGGGRVVWVGSRPGRGADFESLQREHPSLRAENIEKPGTADLLRVLEENGIRPEVSVDAPGVYSMVHHLRERSWLFVINSKQEATTVEVTFRSARPVRMTALPRADETISLGGAKAHITCKSRSVQVWSLDGVG